jgi:hypothetical protein
MAGAILSSEAIMENVSEFSIVTYLRKPGHWRADNVTYCEVAFSPWLHTSGQYLI